MRRLTIAVLICGLFLTSCGNIATSSELSLYSESNSSQNSSLVASSVLSTVHSNSSNEYDEEEDDTYISSEYSIPWSLNASEEEIEAREEWAQGLVKYFDFHPLNYSESLDLSGLLKGKIVTAEYWSIYRPTAYHDPEFFRLWVCNDGTSVFLSIKWNGAIYDWNKTVPNRERVAVLNQTVTNQLTNIIGYEFSKHYSFYQFYKPDMSKASCLIPMDGSQYYVSGKEGDISKILYREIPEFYYSQDENTPEYDEFSYPIRMCKAFSDFGAREDIDWLVP